MSVALGCVAENTPKYLGQALRLIQSVRWFGGTLNEAELYVCVVDGIYPDYRKELESYGVTIHIVPRFSAKHPQSNKLRFLELPDLSRHDRILLLDCDTIVVRDPSPHLFRSDFTAKIVDVPTVPLDTFSRLFAAFGLSMPEATQRCTASGESTIPYFNAGVLAFSRRAMDTLVPKWIELNQQLIARMELLEEHKNFCEQASLSLSLAATGIPFEAVGNAFNFPMHFDNPTSAPCLTDIDPFIVHYHWLVDPSGYILPSAYPSVNRCIDEFNARLRKERESRFDNRLFWNQRYTENPELGSGIGSRGEARNYKRQLLEEAAARWAPRTILDVGCGDLEVGSALPAKGYTGLDFSEVVVAANLEEHPNRAFLVGNFLEMEAVSADMVVCLDVLIHLASRDDYRNFVRKLVQSARKVGIVAGDETNPALGGIVFYHEPLSHTLAEAGATNIRKIGAYRHVTIFEFTPPPPEHRDALVVLGMHRSGTSAVAGVMHLLGAEVGRGLLLGQNDDNPKGFWELKDVVRLHNRLLKSLDSGWYDERPFPDGWLDTPIAREIQLELAEVLRNEFSGMALWAIKDPRLCRLVPLWDKLLTDLGIKPFYLLVVRDPIEVAASLARRNGLVEEKTYLLWLSYVLESERDTRNKPRFVVSYDTLLKDWRTALAPLVETYGLPLTLNDVDAVARVNDFLEPALRHHAKSVSLDGAEEPLRKAALDTYEAILANDTARLDQLGMAALQAIGHYMPWLNQINGLMGHLEVCESKSAEFNSVIISLESEVARIKRTFSWRVTGSLRVLANLKRWILKRGEKG